MEKLCEQPIGLPRIRDSTTPSDRPAGRGNLRHHHRVKRRGQFRIIARWNSAPHGYGKVWFTDRDTARAVGTALLAWAGNEKPLADQQWTSDDGTVVRVTVEPATPFLHIGDCFWPLAIDDAIDLGQRLIVWAGFAR